MVNPRTESSGEQSQNQLRESARKPDLYWECMLSMEALRQPFVSRLQLRRAVSIHSYRLWLTLQSMRRDQARSVGIRWPSDLGVLVEQMATRGVQVAFVFAGGESGIDQLRVRAGSALQRLWPRVHIIDCDDRTLIKGALRDGLSGETRLADS